MRINKAASPQDKVDPALDGIFLSMADISPSRASAINKKTGTMAPEARFRAGFSSGNASERIEGNINKGTASIRTKSCQVRCLIYRINKNTTPRKYSTAEITSKAGRVVDERN